MYQNLKKKDEGFTIIEVLIVLAIAGLIMLIVFLAVPALQRNSRNNARNNDASRISAAVTDCMSNRNNQIAYCLDDGGDADANNDIIPGSLSQFGNIVFKANGYGGTIADAKHEKDTAHVLYNAECKSDGSAAQAIPTGADFKRFTVTWQNENNVNRCISG